MEFKKQFCSREQSKKLENLGLKAKSLHIHVTKVTSNNYEIVRKGHFSIHGYDHAEYYKAYSGDELGVLLSQIQEHECAIYCRKNSFDARLYPQGISRLTIGKNGDNEAIVKADLLILAIEKGIVKPEELEL